MFNPILKILYVDFVQLFELIIYCFYLKHLVNGHCITDKERFITNTFSYFSINQFLLRHFLSFLIILPSYFFPTSFLFFPTYFQPNSTSFLLLYNTFYFFSIYFLYIPTIFLSLSYLLPNFLTYFLSKVPTYFLLIIYFFFLLRISVFGY